jgi:glycosyltransferase involved in cell wall biosynthesis
MTRRVLVVARRFWPACTEATYRLLDWTSLLRKEGLSVTVLTGRWHNSWSSEMTCRDVRIVRILPAPKSAWTESLFFRNLAAWITKHRQDFDQVYVDESSTILNHLGHRSVIANLPLIAKFQGLVSLNPDIPLPLNSITQACEACRKARFVIAPSPLAQRQLLSSGIPAEKIVRIPDIAWSPVHRDPKMRQDAARALRKVNQDFALPIDFKLLIYLGELNDTLTMRSFIEGMAKVFEQQPKLRVWMVGTGRGLPDLYDQVKRHCLHHDILFQSPFDDIDPLLQVCDGLLFPESDSGAQHFLPNALTAGIPIIATENSLIRHSLPAILTSKLVKRPTADEFAHAISDWYCRTDDWNSDSEKARQSLITDNVYELGKQAWLKLFRSG